MAAAARRLGAPLLRRTQAAVMEEPRWLGGSLLQRTQAAVAEERRRLLVPSRFMHSRHLSSEAGDVVVRCTARRLGGSLLQPWRTPAAVAEEQRGLMPSSLMHSRELSSEVFSEGGVGAGRHWATRASWRRGVGAGSHWPTRASLLLLGDGVLSFSSLLLSFSPLLCFVSLHHGYFHRAPAFFICSSPPSFLPPAPPSRSASASSSGGAACSSPPPLVAACAGRRNKPATTVSHLRRASSATSASASPASPPSPSLLPTPSSVAGSGSSDGASKEDGSDHQGCCWLFGSADSWLFRRGASLINRERFSSLLVLALGASLSLPSKVGCHFIAFLVVCLLKRVSGGGEER